jgi:alpha-amylase
MSDPTTTTTDDRTPTPINATLLQAFEWYVEPDGKHWKRLAIDLVDLSKIGITAMWIPPAAKATSPMKNGYDTYDLWDLGEFDYKGSKATKWGPKEDLIELTKRAADQNVLLYLDTVLNHKAGADKTERMMIQEVQNDDRTKPCSGPYEIDGWVGFGFPIRGDQYSSMKWHWYHFSGVDYNQQNGKTAVYQILSDSTKHWATAVDTENHNDDYLMFSNIDHSHPEVQDEIKKWSLWVARELGLHGFRFDAVKHFSEDFLCELLNYMQDSHMADFFCVGEYWKDDIDTMTKYLERMGRKFSLFDTPLVYNFSRISNQASGDLRKVFDRTLVQCEPVNSVTLVMNHDTQPGQGLSNGTSIPDYFKPLGYALILLRPQGYPCVFYGDLYGTGGPFKAEPSCGGQLADIVLARKLYSYGECNDYWDYPTCLGWVRRGTWDKPDGCAVVISNAGPGQKRMYVGNEHAGETWTDVLNWERSETKIEDDGFGTFVCPGCSCSIWVNRDAKGRDEFGKFKPNVSIS